MAFVKVGSLTALPPGAVMEALVGEDTYDPNVKLDRFPIKVKGDDILIDPHARA
jgi:hypothetical protein